MSNPFEPSETDCKSLLLVKEGVEMTSSPIQFYMWRIHTVLRRATRTFEDMKPYHEISVEEATMDAMCGKIDHRETATNLSVSLKCFENLFSLFSMSAISM